MLFYDNIKDNINPIERELANTFDGSKNHYDTESSSQGKIILRRMNLGISVMRTSIPRQDRFLETIEIFTNEINLRLSQEMDSMMSMMHSQINRAISSVIVERVTPEIQNMVSSLSA